MFIITKHECISTKNEHVICKPYFGFLSFLYYVFMQRSNGNKSIKNMVCFSFLLCYIFMHRSNDHKHKKVIFIIKSYF